MLYVFRTEGLSVGDQTFLVGYSYNYSYSYPYSYDYSYPYLYNYSYDYNEYHFSVG